LSLPVMRRAFREKGINLGPSLWALVDGPPPPAESDLTPEFKPWVFRRGLTGRRDPTPGQLTLF
jgi:DNA polymerase-1